MRQEEDPGPTTQRTPTRENPKNRQRRDLSVEREIALMESIGAKLKSRSSARATLSDLWETEKAMSPKAASPPGYYIEGRSRPAYSFGGDLFDFTESGDASTIMLGDVAGKGLEAFPLRTAFQATLRTSSSIDSSPKECLKLANRILFDLTHSAKFFTAFYASLDSASHSLAYSSAGHHPTPILFSDQRGILPLQTGGMVLGVEPNARFEQQTIPIFPNDIIVVASDGITEAVDSNGEEFGESRLIELVSDYRKNSSKSLIESIFQAVDSYATDTPQKDDMTIVVIHRLPDEQTTTGCTEARS